MLSIATKMFARVEDAVHGLCSCSSFSGSCFRPFRRYVSFRNFCVGGQSIHVTFSTRAANMYTDMPIVDRGATATSGIRAQNAIRFLLGSSVRSALIRSHSPTLFISFFPPISLRFGRRRARAVFLFFFFGIMFSSFFGVRFLFVTKDTSE